jgi:hypothetical protein
VQTATERFDPFLQDDPMLHGLLSQAASQVDLSFINQASQSYSCGFFRAAELVLGRGNPSHLLAGDHTSGNRFEKDLAQSHGFVTNSLHTGATVAFSWLSQHFFGAFQLLLR